MTTEKPIQTVRVQTLTLERFAPFGTFCPMLEPNTPHFGIPPIQFYRDALQLELAGKPPSFSTCRVEPRAFVIDVMEFHSNTGEGILPLDGDVLLQVAPASAPDGSFPLEQLRVFRVPRGTLLAIRPGVWHHAPFALEGAAVNVLIVLPERSYANDCMVVSLENVVRIEF